MGKAKRKKYIHNLATSLIGQLKIEEGSLIDASDLYLFAEENRQKAYQMVLSYIQRMNETTLARIVCCGEKPAISSEDRRNPNSAFHSGLRNGTINCPLDHVHHRGMYQNPPKRNWLADVAEKSGLEIIRHIAATVIVAAMYDVMNKRKTSIERLDKELRRVLQTPTEALAR